MVWTFYKKKKTKWKELLMNWNKSEYLTVEVLTFFDSLIECAHL